MTISVLVVDDDAGFRDLVSRLLLGLGLAVVAQVGTVAAAVEAADRLRPEAALIDIGLPDGDGVELAAVLAALPWRPRVVLISSDPDATTDEDARSEGAIGFLSKAELPSARLRSMLAG